ncbi:MAG: CerR family C-terminal domain-containing protein [Pseudomonadota bacterium]
MSRLIPLDTVRDLDSQVESRTDSRSEATKQALLDAALKLFGDKGYENTSVRDLAAEAEVNVAAVNYHFGGKEGLRYAAIDHLACNFKSEGPGEILSHLSPEKVALMSADEARATLREVMRASFIRATKGESADIKTRYIQRELVQGGKPTDLFFEKVFSIQFALIRSLVSRITGDDPDSEMARIRAVNIIAQNVFLNLARPLVLKALEWDGYSEDKSHAVADAFWLYHE